MEKIFLNQLEYFLYEVYQSCLTELMSLHGKINFPIRISLVNVTKSVMENFISCLVCEQKIHEIKLHRLFHIA